MHEEKIVLTPEETLVVCNMTSTGTKLRDAIAKIKAQRERSATGGEATVEGKKKVSAKDKKSALTEEIEALEGEVPAASASVAKFEEALTAAKATKAEGTGTGEDTDEGEDASESDLM